MSKIYSSVLNTLKRKASFSSRFGRGLTRIPFFQTHSGLRLYRREPFPFQIYILIKRSDSERKSSKSNKEKASRTVRSKKVSWEYLMNLKFTFNSKQLNLWPLTSTNVHSWRRECERTEQGYVAQKYMSHLPWILKIRGGLALGSKFSSAFPSLNFEWGSSLIGYKCIEFIIILLM